MFWETLAAIILIVATLPLWVFFGIFWGIIRAGFTLIVGSIGFLSQPEADWGELWLVPVSALFQGFASAWSIPAEIWAWAKFEHPWWAVIIGLVLIGGSSAGRR